ncbi:response regulator transcription factor [Anaerovorax odorimutans]|uniref:response regulator transcription factor n=1 Tax=Anaerovorax odorimutans TaxID=109327 RepID=UPI000402FACA|nr:response regulator transcription factor [Anaerovorax odorimutans]
MKRIFLVEDEISLCNLLISYLRDAGYDVRVFSDGLEAKNSINEKPDLWILDIMLPGMDGYSLIREIKNYTPNVPVIFMSARSAELDRVIGLEMGSDDYLPKPFLPRELVLRVNRLLKEQTKQEEVMKLGKYDFNRQKRSIIDENEEIALTVKEYDILEFLIANKENAVSRTAIIDAVWGTDYFGSERVVDDTLRRLRKKVPDLPLESAYGYGYILKI